MKKFLLGLIAVFSIASASAQPTLVGVREASAAEVAAGVSSSTFISPRRLAGSAIPLTSIVLPGGGTITGSAGSITATASGTDQNVTLIPSGTGNVVVGAGSLVVPSGGTISNGTVGFVFSNGLVGNSNIDRGVLSLSATSATAPAFTRRDDSDTGVGFAGSNAMSLITGGVAALSIDSTQNITLNGPATGNNRFALQAAGADPFIWYRVTGGGGGEWSVGPDFTDSNAFVWVNGSSLTGTNMMRLSPTGALTLSGSIAAGANTVLGWTGLAQMLSASDGIIRLSNNAQSDFSRLQFGGTTSSFPAIKRSGAALAFRLADDSADADITTGKITPSGPIVPRSTTVAYAASVTPNVDTTDVLNIGTLTGDITINAPSGTPSDGQRLLIRFAQDGTGGRAVTLNAAFVYTDDVTALLVPTAASKKWDMLFIYNSAASKYVASAINRGTP